MGQKMFDAVGLLKRLEHPQGPVDVVLDTDTYNEIDDQFALAYLIRSGDKLNLKAIYAAPFFNSRVESPREGMEKSHAEIMNVLSLMGEEALKAEVYRGSGTYLPDETTPVISDAAKDLAKRAMRYTPEKPLYVIAIAAITNVASALLLKPEIADRMVVVWLGGHSFEWDDNREFNLYQDVAGARVLLDSGAAVVLLPCNGVVSAFATTKYELEHWLKEKNPLCDYLVQVTCDEAKESRRGRCWSKPIWDVTAVAWLLDGFMRDRLEAAPIPEYDHRWAFSKVRHPIRYVYHINRDRLMEDLFQKLSGQEK